MLMSMNCCLCSQIAGRQSNDLIASLLPDQPYVRRIMLETPSFAVLPSLGPLTQGHSLVCPKVHIRSFADLDARAYQEFQDVKRSIASSLARLYSASVHIFEHGMAASGNHIVCTVDHAHMHFVPLPKGVSREPIEEIPWKRFDGSRHELLRLSAGREYIFYESPEGIQSLLSSESELQSQFMRRVIAKALSSEHKWNWREHPEAASADETWRNFVARLQA